MGLLRIFRAFTATGSPKVSGPQWNADLNYSGELPVANGGTGASSASAALTNLGAAPIDSPTFTTSAQAPTEASSENSAKIATTAWAKAGFAVSVGTTGYIKFPTWLGGAVFQWGGLSLGSSGSTVTFPIAFPSAVVGVLVTAASTAGRAVNYQSLTLANVYLQSYVPNTMAGEGSYVTWFAVGW